jgi:hypothetical protein
VPGRLFRPKQILPPAVPLQVLSVRISFDVVSRRPHHPRPRRGPQPAQPLRAAGVRPGRARGPARRRRRGRRRRPAYRLPQGHRPHDHRPQRQPRRRLHLQHQPLPRLQSRLHLLLRPPDPPIRRLLRRVGLRDQDPREGRRAAVAPQGTGGAALCAGDPLHQRRDRLLPAGGEAVSTHAQMPRGAARLPQPRRHHHQEPPGDPRHRHPVGDGEARHGGSDPVDHVAGPGTEPPDGAARRVAAAPRSRR